MWVVRGTWTTEGRKGKDGLERFLWFGDSWLSQKSLRVYHWRSFIFRQWGLFHPKSVGCFARIKGFSLFESLEQTGNISIATCSTQRKVSNNSYSRTCLELLPGDKTILWVFPWLRFIWGLWRRHLFPRLAHQPSQVSPRSRTNGTQSHYWVVLAYMGVPSLMSRSDGKKIATICCSQTLEH